MQTIRLNLYQTIKTAATLVLRSLSCVRGRRLFLVCLAWVVILVACLYTFTDIATVLPQYLDQGSEDNIRLYRDVYTQERWPEVEYNISFPGEIPQMVHYFWCGRKEFRFEHYLSLLSAIRVLKPQKLVFHYHQLPVVDSFWYHTWFQEFKQSVPNLVLRYTSHSPRCGSRDILTLTFGAMAKEGGIYVGERTIVTGVPREARDSDFWASLGRQPSSDDVTQGLVFSRSGFSGQIPDVLVSSPQCMTVGEYDNTTWTVPGSCLVVWESVFPRDVWNSSSRFGQLARWLFYGHRKRLQVKPDPPDSPLIPMVSHMVWMRSNHFLKSNEFRFLHFLSVQSALHVAGFQHVYIHGDLAPFGIWWRRLEGHNVTFVKIEKPETIFQQGVKGPAHQSDVLRLNTLLRHGGVYQDRDVIWVNKIPDWLRRYQAVACVDWPRNGAWPEVFNLGVLMAKPNADWLKHFLKTFTYYRDDKWAFNAVMQPYKAYEFHPDTLYVDRKLQVICFRGICHPAWHDDYIREIDDVTPVRPFDWREARAFHFTVPKPPPSLVSPQAIARATDMPAQIGRMVLEKSGQGHLLTS